MTSTKENEKAGKTAKTNPGRKTTKQTQTAKSLKETKETTTKRNNGHGPDKAAVAIGSTAKTDGAPSPNQRK
eukprot:2008039-Ditylum_brightwellii.AAC.1